MTPTQRAAAERLADLLDSIIYMTDRNFTEAAALLRELLAEPRGEPVAWRSKTRINNDFDSNWCLTSTEPPQTPRTIAIEPLYTHPPQQRKPFSHAQMADLIRAEWGIAEVPSAWNFGRAIERAHGIVEAP